MESPATRDHEHPSLTLRRRFDAAPAKVWRAWTEPQALKQRFGPAEIVSVPVAEIDLRPGGRFRVVMRAGRTLMAPVASTPAQGEARLLG